MPRPATLLLVLAVAPSLAACRPDVPGRDCEGPDDCFTQEVCADGVCVEASAAGGQGGEQGEGGASEDQNADASETASDAGAPDAQP